MSTNLDQLQAATLSLTRPGPIKDRLTDAYRNHLAFVEEEDLPTELCEEFRAITHYLTRERPLIRGEDALRATVRKLSSDEAAEVASAIVRMFAAVSRDAVNRPARGKAPKQVNVLALYAGEA